MFISLKTITAITMATGLITFPTIAYGQDNLNSWAKEAGREISASMEYPMLALRQGDEGSLSFVVTVNRDGNVVAYHPTGHKSAIHFKSSAIRSLKNTEFPPLPRSYSPDQLSFTLDMVYQQQEDPERKFYHQGKRKKGAVTGTRIALLHANTSVSGK